MHINRTYIFLRELSFYAFHGVAEQEQRVGNVFIVNVKLKVDFSKAVQTDSVTDTVSYADVFQAIKDEMAIPSQLLEHLCARIVQRIFNNFPTVEEVEIELHKQNPPMGADVASAGVEMHCAR